MRIRKTTGLFFLILLLMKQLY